MNVSLMQTLKGLNSINLIELICTNVDVKLKAGVRSMCENAMLIGIHKLIKLLVRLKCDASIEILQYDFTLLSYI